jgi:WhiB family redox-sensing transcriptional regulator
VTDLYDDAACRDMNQAIFYPDGTGAYIYMEAKAICEPCPVRDACLEMAMRVEAGRELGYRHGMFGGLSPRQRWNLDRSGGWVRARQAA